MWSSRAGSCRQCISDRPEKTWKGFQSLAVYWDDVTVYEPKLLEMYDELIPRIDSALGE